MNKEFEVILNKLGEKLDDLNWLSNAGISLSRLLYYHNNEVAQAELAETKTAIALIDQAKDKDGKLSVAEAEKRAVVSTGNMYGTLKLRTDAIVETINSIKKKIEVLSWERKNQQ